MGITSKRKVSFCSAWAKQLSSPIGFIDVGSGGPLKHPWDLIPPACIKKFDFEPTSGQDPLCISDRSTNADFFVALDERSSSLHSPSKEYMDWFGDLTVSTKKILRVRLDTLDKLFLNNTDIDCIDINAEGHDYFVLKGAGRLFEHNFIKLVKVEFELTNVWQGQAWFGDIDSWMRHRGYDLGDIDMEFKRPLNAAGILHRGEPVWGKAYYVPSISRTLKVPSDTTTKDHVLKSILLYVIFDMPGRAFDLIERYGTMLDKEGINSKETVKKITSIYKFVKVDQYGRKILNKSKGLSKLLKVG